MDETHEGEITISDVNNQTFPDLSIRDDIEDLYIIDNPDLTRFTSLPPSLDSLLIQQCKSLVEIPDLPRDLQSFFIENCPALGRIPDLPNHLRYLSISSSPLVKIQSLPRNLERFICDLDQLEELCKNDTFLESIMYLLQHDLFFISRPDKYATEDEKQVFIEKMEEIKSYKKDTRSALEVPLQSASPANRGKKIVEVFDIAGREILAHANPYTTGYNQLLIDDAKEVGRSYVDTHQGSAQGSGQGSASYLKVEGGKSKKSKKQKGSKKSKRRKRKYTKKRRRTSKK